MAPEPSDEALSTTVTPPTQPEPSPPTAVRHSRSAPQTFQLTVLTDRLGRTAFIIVGRELVSCELVRCYPARSHQLTNSPCRQLATRNSSLSSPTALPVPIPQPLGGIGPEQRERNRAEE